MERCTAKFTPDGSEQFIRVYVGDRYIGSIWGVPAIATSGVNSRLLITVTLHSQIEGFIHPDDVEILQPLEPGEVAK